MHPPNSANDTSTWPRGSIRPGRVDPIPEDFDRIDWLRDWARELDQLWDTTINPETRRLMQVRIEDMVEDLEGRVLELDRPAAEAAAQLAAGRIQ